MSNHQASEQMIGYLYQVRYALSLLLKNDDDQAQISIEKFDDIAFSNDDTPRMLIQLKHHIKHHGDLNNASTDIWRTLKVWIDAINKSSDLLKTTKFIIITTASAPEGTAAYYLKNHNDRNIELAYHLLKKVCEESSNKGHAKYYRAFTSLHEKEIKQLLDNVIVIDRSSNIIDVESELKREIRYSCLPQYEDFICERLEGWWYKKSVEALCSDNPIYVSQSQVRSYIVSVSREYSPDNLPIDIMDFQELNLDDLPTDEKIFYEQLKLICFGNNRMRMALRDYYRAFKQRANWVRNDLLYVNELEDYERKLIDEWEHYFYVMQDDLEDYDDEITEKIKVKSGKKLFSTLEEKDIRIREKCSEAFVMRGSYYILANQLKIGWHTDFYERLKFLLEQRGDIE
ncbi:hypothetical protein FDF50_12010 [Clostridium botulinum]|uniref:ABC-three component system protein n=1 Tax=Clostridium botulinum TaxID=1491 RepID=UPI00035BAAF7|nr:ABC-three component system protein [Clostridium botulinum]EPS50623.1 hypothetical protein CFSAN002367_10184 [Clostridium botulinum CFSAN002367]KON10975.1 hypothetical protein ACP52_02415 [Clostridium botulinum]MBD5587421.1 hypothetical protein [Clostridium botulinum]MBO0571617.1 hypothetical protein [Clostridium botulinum]MBY6904184.1 hypothetical protein [Clostridium botulinum]